MLNEGDIQAVPLNVSVTITAKKIPAATDNNAPSCINIEGSIRMVLPSQKMVSLYN